MSNANIKKWKKIGTLKSEVASKSRHFKDPDAEDFIDTNYPLLNLALSGRIRDGGITSGITCFAGESKNFKSAYLCICMAAFQKKHPDGIVIFYDNEFGTKKSYLDSFGVDMERVLHIPLENIEDLKFDLTQKLASAEEDEKIFIGIDSLGNIASKKEIDDAMAENSAVDMTRAKQMKSLGRLITPSLNSKNIPLVAINHTYQTLENYSKQVMSGGTGIMYSAHTVFFIGKQKETGKTSSDLLGNNFIITVNKSRFIKEGSKFPFIVTYEDGVKKYSGLFDLMMEHTDKVEKFGSWYKLKGEDKKVRRSEIESDEFMEELLNDNEFIKTVENKYKLSGPKPLSLDEILDEEDLKELESDFE